MKGTKTREKLVQAVQLWADQTLRECGIQKADERILAVTSRDIVAAEAHYPISCYKKCTVKVTANKKKADDGEDTYQIVKERAFADLFEFIQTDVIPNKRIVSD